MNATVIELPTVESLSDEIRGVVYERQTLRAVGAGREELERNRAELVQPAAGTRRRPHSTPPPRERGIDLRRWTGYPVRAARWR